MMAAADRGDSADAPRPAASARQPHLEVHPLVNAPWWDEANLGAFQTGVKQLY
ncbi:MAG TPA: hypothetical protein VNT26_03010 [Candidatus Sulfotelmatobacter sp.]|nr:hypothetical protein [Candidatus Sulfotelmatobacter sp.]